ncbi:MAG: hypothetical protein IJC21_01805 [Lentisphaeria bacterium]|nr:hypothetical protein [Lentisphaeria bacterium]
MTLERFCELCGFNADEEKIIAGYLADEKINAAGLEICRLCFEAPERPETFPEPVEDDDLAKANLVSAFYGIEYAKQIHASLGIPQYILENGMRDIAIWSRHELRDKGVFGIRRGFHWTNVLYRAVALRFGRLECNLTRGFRLDELRDEAGNLLLKKDDPLIGLHIPADGALDIDACIDSMRKMAEFFDWYKPDYHYKGFVVDTWLVDPLLAQFLPPESNIVRFQQLGIQYLIQDEYDPTFWLWGTRDPEKVANPSELQRKALAFIKSGGVFKYYGMYIPKERIVKAAQ